MRIAIDCRSVFHGMGGIGRYAASLLQELPGLDRKNEYVAYFTHLEPPKDFKLSPQISAKRFEAGMIDERFDQLILPTLLESDRIDLYHNPTFSVPVIRTRARTVATVHDVVFRRHPELVEPRLRQYLDRSTQRSCKFAHRMISVSEFSKGELIELYKVSPERVTVIHNGVFPAPQARTSGFLPSGVTSLGLAPKSYLLYVGSIEPKKNLNVLLQMMALLMMKLGEKCPTLVLAGARNGSSYPIEAVIEHLGLKSWVRLAGYVAPQDLEGLYTNARVFVYPSLYEGFGLPPLEAMARGVPTVVSDVSSLPEVVGDSALMVPAANASAWAEAILGLIENEHSSKELSQKGEARASEFTWTKSAQRHLEVFEEVMSRHEHPASVL